MLTHLTKPLTKGEKIKATLTFEHAGPLEVEFTVQSIGASGGGGMMKGGEMGGMKM
jgi:copper(I)-binding protein